MRLLVCALVLASIVAVAGCTYPNSPVNAALIIDQKGPVAGFDTSSPATKTGTAKAEGILFVGFGDASVKAAMDQGKISKVHHVDSEVFNILGIYSRYTTVVYGE